MKTIVRLYGNESGNGCVRLRWETRERAYRFACFRWECVPEFNLNERIRVVGGTRRPRNRRK